MAKKTIGKSVKCGNCSAVLDEPVDTPAKDRAPCPYCGSKKRTFNENINASVKMCTRLSGLHERNGETIGFFESMRQGRASISTIGDEGSVNISLIGSSPQGEEDTVSTCQILKERLNLDGANWGDIITGKEPADCIFVDADNAKKTLEVQVIRAIISQKLWRDLNCQGSVNKSFSPADAVKEIKAAIERKANDKKIPKSMRSKLVLALDATRLPGLAFDAVVRKIRSENMKWLVSHGFAAIWLVGPTSRLVLRLDKEN